jgi:hypothetical protein
MRTRSYSSPWHRRAIHALCAFVLASSSLLALAAPNERVALLVGNNAYQASPLRSAVNDVRDLGAALREMGFRTIVRENATRKDMIDAIRQFGQAIEGAEVALFFFAGHALQYKERNYLIPVDAQMGSEDDVTFFSVEVAQVFDRMDRARTRFNLLILDACRNNPFEASFKVASAGLAQMSAPSGTLIAYATAPGAVAADGFGRNGIYTKHILQHIAAPDLPVELLFKRVREGVERETLSRQTPWDSSSLKGDFIFNASNRTASAAPGGPSPDMQLQIEREFWVSVRDSSRIEDVEAYLAKYPNGQFAALARNRLDALLRPPRSSAPAPRPAPEPVVTAAGGPATTATAAASLAGSPGPIAMAAPPTAGTTPGGATGDRSVAALVPPSPAATAGAAGAPQAGAGPPSVPAAPATTTQLPRSSSAGREIAPGVTELTYDDGAIYRGGMQDGTMHGKGEYRSTSFRYQGEFRNGRRDGKGTYVWANGDTYEGEFAEDKPQGTGLFRFASGDRYDGEVKAGVIEGRGVYVSAHGDQFEGTFVDGKPEGLGVYRFANGDRYEGQVAAGKPQGRGRYFARSGERIEATFANGSASGKGVCHFANGDRYEGDFRAGALTGKGTYFYNGGVTYEGDIVDGRPLGRGTFHFADGSRFDGTFEDGLARARGTLVRADGSTATAVIVDGAARVVD